MKNFRDLAEEIETITETAITGGSRDDGNKSKQAFKFFKNKELPDGSKWGGSFEPKLGFANQPVVTKVKKEKTKDGMIFTAQVTMTPGKGGGGGAGMSAAASNHLFNMMGTDQKSVTSVSKAFDKYIKRHSKKLNETLRRWLIVPDNFMHRMVGWNQRNNYVVKDVSFKAIKYKAPMVDPTRRKWPAGRTEIWQPMVADVVITLKKK